MIFRLKLNLTLMTQYQFEIFIAFTSNTLTRNLLIKKKQPLILIFNRNWLQFQKLKINKELILLYK
jgi:hypothetical protein